MIRDWAVRAVDGAQFDVARMAAELDGVRPRLRPYSPSFVGWLVAGVGPDTPYLREVAAHWGPSRRARLSVVAPRSRISAHVDGVLGSDVRVHVAIREPAGSALYVREQGGVQSYAMLPGRAYACDTAARLHWVENPSAEERVHLIFDLPADALAEPGPLPELRLPVNFGGGRAPVERIERIAAAADRAKKKKRRKTR